MATSSAWTRAIWPCAVLRDSCKTNPRPTSPWGGTRADRFTHRPQRHSPPGDAGTARRGMKTVSCPQCSNRSSGRKKKPGRQSETGPNPNLCPIRRQNRTSFEAAHVAQGYVAQIGWTASVAVRRCLPMLPKISTRELFDPAAFGASLSLKSQPRGEVDGSRKPER